MGLPLRVTSVRGRLDAEINADFGNGFSGLLRGEVRAGDNMFGGGINGSNSGKFKIAKKCIVCLMRLATFNSRLRYAVRLLIKFPAAQFALHHPAS